MKMTSQLATIILCLLMSMSQQANAGDWGDLTPAEEQVIDDDVRSSFRSLFFGDISLQGIVVDEATNLLNDVNLSIKFSPDRLGSITTNVNGTFIISCTNCSRISLGFRKEGFFTAGGRFIINRNVPVAGSGKRVISNTNMVIVLVSREGAVRLESSRKDIVFSTTANQVGVTFTNSKMVIQSFPSITNLPDVEDLIYIDVATDNGFIATSNYLFRGNLVRWPQSLILRMATETNGFVEFVPPNGIKSITGTLRFMRDAPESGYTNALVIDPVAPETFFFIRTKGIFGKGFLGRIPRARTNDTRVLIDLGVDIRLDGGRNLRNLDGR